MDKPVPTMGMSLRRGGAKLRAIGKAHSPLHVLLWQSKETQRALSAAAAAQLTLYRDVASWAAAENRALRDVCSNAAELSELAAAAQLQLSLAYKAFRKDMSLVLEGERRRDAAHKSFLEAENKRVKLKKQYNHAKDRPPNRNGETPKRTVDVAALRTQLAEAERTTDRAHMTVNEASREQEAVKLVVLRTALTKLSQAHLTLAAQTETIFQALRQVSNEIPDPPPPDDHLGTTEYTGFERTREVLDRAKMDVEATGRSPRPNGLPQPQPRHFFTSTPVPSPASSSSPNGHLTDWPLSPMATAPSHIDTDVGPPPPYNLDYYSPNRRGPAEGPSHGGQNRSRGSGSHSRRHNTVSPSISVTSAQHRRPEAGHCPRQDHDPDRPERY